MVALLDHPPEGAHERLVALDVGQEPLVDAADREKAVEGERRRGHEA
jgi:hypothetical protein